MIWNPIPIRALYEPHRGGIFGVSGKRHHGGMTSGTLEPHLGLIDFEDRLGNTS